MTKWKKRVKGSSAQIGQPYRETPRKSHSSARTKGSGSDLPPRNRSVDSMKFKDPRKTAKYWRAHIIDASGNPQVIYGVAFTDYGQTPEGRADHVSHVQGFGKPKKMRVHVFKDGQSWYDEQYSQDPKKVASQMRINANNKYVAGRITRATWQKKMREADKLAAPSRDEVIQMMRKREIAQGLPKDPNKRYNGWANWDTWNTMLLLNNTQRSHRWLGEWSKNFNRKIKAGTFDPEKAETVVNKHLVPAARGARSKRWAVGEDFTADPDIDPKKVNKAEVIRHIIQHND